MPTPFKLIARLLIVSSLVLWLAHVYQRALIEPLLPSMRTIIAAVQDDFIIYSLDISDEATNETIRLRGNLAKPVVVGGRTFYPIGWGTRQQGGLQVTLTVGGAVQYSLLMLIVVLAWPIAHGKELLKRLLISLPLMLGLVLLNVASTFPAELWAPIHDEWVPDITWPLLLWSRLLMGGGGLALGLFGAALSILFGKYSENKIRLGQWRASSSNRQLQ